MKISEMIRKKRKEQGMTQERVAAALGVTAPAVNKWEKGITCPDIALLPALARLLKTDLNTLLSFQEELTQQEIGNFAQEINALIEKEGFAAGFAAAIEKIREFPNCERLLYILSFTLGSALMLDTGLADKKSYEQKLEEMYGHLAESSDDKIRSAAVTMLFSGCLEREEYETAQGWLDSLPPLDQNRQILRINLFTRQKKFDQALVLIEQKLLTAVTDVQSALMKMLEIAIQENRMEEARLFADRHEGMIRDFDLMPYMAAAAQLELAVAQKDAVKSIGILKQMLPDMTKKWDLTESVFYRHMNSGSDASALGLKFLPSILRGIENDEEFAFLRERAELKEIIEKMKNINSAL